MRQMSIALLISYDRSPYQYKVRLINLIDIDSDKAGLMETYASAVIIQISVSWSDKTHDRKIAVYL